MLRINRPDREEPSRREPDEYEGQKIINVAGA